MKNLHLKKAVVLLSGGQDSVTCLLWALKEFEFVHALSFDYAQRHKIELQCAVHVCNFLNVPYTCLNIETFKQIGDSALLNTDNVSEMKDGLPASFVPGRNLILLTYASAFAYKLGIGNIVTGVCQTDYSGYYDCRQVTIDALQKAINLGILGTEKGVYLHTPLMYLTKKDTWLLAEKSHIAGVDIIIKYTHTCYNGDHTTKNIWGYGCGKCPACKLRAQGYHEFKYNAKRVNI